MRIAQIAPPWERVSASSSSALHRMIFDLTDALTGLGHDVTVFDAAWLPSSSRRGDGKPHPSGIKNPSLKRNLPLVMLWEQVVKVPGRFDVIHSHAGFFLFPMLQRSPVPAIATVCDRLSIMEIAAVFDLYEELPLVAVSDRQPAALPWLNWMGTIPYGLGADTYRLGLLPSRSLVVAGRGDARSLLSAVEVGTELGFHVDVLEPEPAGARQDDPDHEPRHLGTLASRLPATLVERRHALSRAAALIACPDSSSALNDDVLEALACGTPVVVYGRVEALDLIEQGVTGVVCDTRAKLEEALRGVPSLSRAACRAWFEAHATASVAAASYHALYDQLVRTRAARSSAGRGTRRSSKGTAGMARRFPHGRPH
ncbi:glycosyltransferase [Candidatus Nitrospira bockiana]